MRLSLFSTIIAALGLSTASAFTVSTSTTGSASRNVVVSMSESSSEGKRTGIVKWFNTEKGFGFIVPDDGESDVFVHQTSIVAEGFRSLADGEPVEFVTVEDPRTGKIKAHDVTGPGGANVQGAPYEPGY